MAVPAIRKNENPLPPPISSAEYPNGGYVELSVGPTVRWFLGRNAGSQPVQAAHGVQAEMGAGYRMRVGYLHVMPGLTAGLMALDQAPYRPYSESQRKTFIQLNPKLTMLFALRNREDISALWQFGPSFIYDDSQQGFATALNTGLGICFLEKTLCNTLQYSATWHAYPLRKEYLEKYPAEVQPIIEGVGVSHGLTVFLSKYFH